MVSLSTLRCELVTPRPPSLVDDEQLMLEVEGFLEYRLSERPALSLEVEDSGGAWIVSGPSQDVADLREDLLGEFRPRVLRVF